MDYLKLKTSNKMLKDGLMPNIKKINDEIIAGFGSFDDSKRMFEFPVHFEKTDRNNIIFNEWFVDETKVVFESLSNNGEKQVIHCNLTELEFKIKPLLNLFCINQVKMDLKKNKIFHFTDVKTKRRFFISHQEDYKNFYG